MIMKALSLFLSILTAISLTACSVDNRLEHAPDITDTIDTTEGTGVVTSKEEETSSAEVTSTADEPFSEDIGLTPIYDNTAVVNAYNTGDISALSEKDLAIYNFALEALDEFYSEGMSHEDIVIGAHDWLVTHTVYDEAMLLPVPVQTEDTENPYGVFTRHQAICMGYTTTFQLFMDMLDVKSIIVRGSSSDEEHAWNMVSLDDKWYHVDVTWDDFVPDEAGRPPFHTYTFVPDYVMEQMHMWDRESSPIADSEDRIYLKTHGYYAQTKEECAALLAAAHAAGQRYAEIMLDSEETIAFDYTEQYWIHQFGNYIVVTFWMQ